MAVEKLKGDQKGGILDKLINKGALPDVNVSLSTETIKELSINLGAAVLIVAVIIILLNAIIKTISK